MRTLAIDLGARRVGLALSDEGGRLATPFDVLELRTPEALLGAITDLCRREQVQQIVVGLALNMDGTRGPAAQTTICWASQLAEHTKLPVLLVDERLSTFEAEQNIAARKRAGEHLTRKRKKSRLDALAAAAFLQAYLDGKLPALPLSH
jgi:putative Holliday junction resolvase